MQLQNPELLPEDYEDYRLCKAFGWLPSQLDDENAEIVARYLAYYNAELKHESIRQQATPAPTRKTKTLG